MNVSITEIERKTMYGSDYVFVSLHTDRHAASVIIAKGHANYVQVTVKNASHRAYRGAGKRFLTVEAAIASYKTKAIRSMIEAAADAATTAQETPGIPRAMLCHAI